MSDFAALAELDASLDRFLEDRGIRRNAPGDPTLVAERLGIEVQSLSGAAEGRLALRNGRAVIQELLRQVRQAVGDSRWPMSWGTRTCSTRAGSCRAQFVGGGQPRRPSATILRRACCSRAVGSSMPPTARPRELATLMHLANRSGVSLAACSLRLLRLQLWTDGLFAWRREERVWHLRTAAGMSPAVRSRLVLDPVTARLLTNLRGTTGHPRLRLLMSLGPSEPRAVTAQLAINNAGCLGLIPLRTVRGRWEPRWHQHAQAEAPRTTPPADVAQTCTSGHHSHP